MELTLDRISKQFQNHIAVDGFSYTLSNGVYGLLGANGAGKTTLMRMICTVLNPTSGEILFNGTSISDIGAKYCDILGYLPQNFGYYPDFSAHEFLLYMASLKGIQGRAAKHRVEELLQMVGLSDVSRQKIRSFSGGMKQRLGGAQAVAGFWTRCAAPRHLSSGADYRCSIAPHTVRPLAPARSATTQFRLPVP